MLAKKNQQHQQIPRRVLTDILKNGSPKNNIKNNFRDGCWPKYCNTKEIAQSPRPPDFNIGTLS